MRVCLGWVYNSGVRWFLAFAVCAALIAGEKKPAQGHEENDSVAITATIVNPEELVKMFGTGFEGDYTVLNVTVAPKGGKPYAVDMNDFILRSESSLNHSGPMSAGEIAGAGQMVIQRVYGNRANVDSPQPLEGTKMKIDDKAEGDPALNALKQKMLAEKTITEPESGLLFFPLQNEKPKHLVLSCATPGGKLRVSFK